MFIYVCQNIIRSLFLIFHQVIMHFWFNFHLFSFFKIAVAKTIRLPTSLSKDSSMRNDISLSALFWLILSKADTKVLKQQLFNEFWKYLRIRASLWNLNYSTHFSFPIGTWNILNLFISCVLSWLWKSFFIEIRLTCAKIYLNPIIVKIKKCCDLAYWPWKLNLGWD